MMRAYLNTRERAAYAVATLGGDLGPCGPGMASSVGAAAQSRAGWVPLRGWARWGWR
jgi:hypothetical protein